MSKDGKVVIVGGQAPPSSGPKYALSSVEIWDPVSGSCTPLGNLKYPLCYNLVCSSVWGAAGQHVLIVCGAWDDNLNHVIQVYDVRSGTVLNTVTLPYVGKSHVIAAVQIRGHLVVLAQKFTAVVQMDNILHGCARSVRLCEHYKVPSYGCGVAVSADDNHLLVVGGSSTEHVCKARVEDILEDTEAGWQSVRSEWDIVECELYGGYDVAHIVIPVPYNDSTV